MSNATAMTPEQAKDAIANWHAIRNLTILNFIQALVIVALVSVFMGWIMGATLSVVVVAFVVYCAS